MSDVGITEVQAEGVSTLSVEKVANIESVDLTPLKDKPVAKQVRPAPGKATTKKNATGATNARFWPVTRITVGGEATTTWSTISINPYTFTARGESFNLAWKRNLWQGGNNSMGYLTSLQLQAVISRPPQVSGMIEFKDSQRGASTRYHVEFGGRLDFPTMTEVIAFPVRPRHWNTPVVRTNEANVVIRYRAIAFNRTADIADVNVSINARPGTATFHTPIKPKPRATGAFEGLARELDVVYEQSDTPMESEDYIAPEAGDELEEGAIDTYHQEDDVDQDDYWIRVYEGNITPNEVTAVPLNLSVLRDISTISDESTISQKFERFAHIMPEDSGGELGPTIGDYVIHTRLPTGVAASLAHVCVPDDISDEAALRVLGIASILDLATSALASVGGPLISGIVQTVPNLLGGLTGGLLGGKPADNSSTDTASPSTIGGKIPIARFLQFLKPVAENLTADPSFGTLLLSIFDLLSNDSSRVITSIPISVLVRMRGRTERSVFDRSITPMSSIPNRLIIPRDRWAYIVEEFGQTKLTNQVGTRQNLNFKKFMGCVVNCKVNHLYLDDITAYELTETEDAAVQSLIEGQSRVPLTLSSLVSALKR